MTLFWILAAGLLGLAALFVVLPLLLRADALAGDVDQDRINLNLFKQQLAELDADLSVGKLDADQHEAARQDLERELLNDVGRHPQAAPSAPSDRRWNRPLTALALGIAVPAAALALYAMLGQQDMVARLDSAAGGQAPDGLPPLDVLAERLAERMRDNPDDLDGWLMLGRTYFAIQRSDQARVALERAYRLAPRNPDVVLGYAEALAASQNNELEGEPAKLIEAALAIDSDNATARWLSGMLHFQRGQFNAAAVVWEHLVAQLDPASEDAANIRALIDEARGRAGQSPASVTRDEQAAPMAPAATAPPPADQPAAAHPAPPAPRSSVAEAGMSVGLDVEVALADAFAGRVPPNTPVFVYVKAAQGPPMPLAARRLTVADLPARVRLDDSMALMPSMRLSLFPSLIVGARVSFSAQATPMPGDLEGETGPLGPTLREPIQVRIDRARP